MRLANICLTVCLWCVLQSLGTGLANAGATVGDAFVRVDAEGQKWTVGTGQTELGLEFKAGTLSISSCQNKQFDPPKEYLEAAGATGPAMVELNLLGTNLAETGLPWMLEGVDARQVAEGGRPAVELVLTLRRRALHIGVHLLTLPRTPIIRQWMELENTGADTLKFDPAQHHLLAMNLRGNEGSSLVRHHWITGGGEGVFGGAEIGGPYHHKLAGMMSAEFVPWVGLLRKSDATEGMFAALEYLGRWEILIDREATGPIQLTLRTPDVNAELALAPGERLRMPTVTLGVFRDDFDDMGKRLYDWQYEYQWSYTTDEYYALMQWPTHWWGDSHNLQQTFAGRLGWMDMAWPDMLRFTAGFEPLPDSVPEAMVQAIEILPEDKPTVRLNVGSDEPFVDWNSFVWDADTNFDGGTTIRSDAPVAHASPTLFDQAIYQTARMGQALRYVITMPPGLHEVHLKFAELWLKETGKRPMHIDINGRRYWQGWDPGTATGCTGMAMDLRAENIVPDKDGKITLVISAAGENEAILQGWEIN